MVNVIAWPPVGVTAFENTIDDPVSRSSSLLTGRRYVSAAKRSRRIARMGVSGIGCNLADAGYVEMLKRQLKGGVHLVRMNPIPSYWHMAKSSGEKVLGWNELTWTDGTYDVDWSNGAEVKWYDGLGSLTGASGTDGVWDTIAVSGLPANTRAVLPSDTITVSSGGSLSFAKAMREETSDENGEITIRLDQPLPSGDVRIGVEESVVFEVSEMPRAMQPVGGNFGYIFDMRQVFEDETDGFVEVNPWR